MARWVEDGTDTVGALSDSSEPPSPRRRHEQPGAFCRSGGVASRRPLPLARKALQRDRRRASARTARSPWRASWATPGALHTIVPNRDIAGPSDVRGAHLQLQARTTAARAGTGLHSSAWIEEAAAQRARTRNHAATFGRAGTWRLTWRLGMPVPFAYSGAAPEAYGGVAENGGRPGRLCQLAFVPALPARRRTTGSHFTICDAIGGAGCGGSSP